MPSGSSTTSTRGRSGPARSPRLGLDVGDPASLLATLAEDRGRLYGLLLRQHYRLAHWRRANDDLNYRRFFDITTLGALRVEDQQVFEDSHDASSTSSPLATSTASASTTPTACATRSATSSGCARPPPTGLDRGREDPRAGRARRRTEWPVDGTVGYEFADLVLRPLRRRRQRGRAHRALRTLPRRRPARLGRARRRGQARGPRRAVPGRAPPAPRPPRGGRGRRRRRPRRGRARPCPRPRARRLPGLPHLRPRGRGRDRRRGPALRRRGGRDRAGPSPRALRRARPHPRDPDAGRTAATRRTPSSCASSSSPAR